MRGMPNVITITRGISIAEEELEFRFVHSGGPGGQNVNKVATACQLRFDATGSSLPPEVKQRLVRLAGRRMSADGVLLLDARRFRTQHRNRQDALERFIDLLRRAAATPKKRKPTRPTAAARRKRLDAKRRRGNIKKLRGPANE
jgi:ribosome-associated protein